MSKKNEYQPKSYLSWTKEDYIKNNEEVPEILINNPGKTEAELMTDQNIIDWITDTQKTFCIVREQNKEVFNQLYQGFVLDLEYLVKSKRIDEDTADELMNIDNFEF